MSKITINGITLDPEVEKPQLAAFGLSTFDSSKSDFILIQTTKPLTKEQRDQLEALKVTILEYVPEKTYVARYPENDLSSVAALPFVTWVNPYLQEFKIAPALRGHTIDSAPANLLRLAPFTASASLNPKQVDVVLHRDIEANEVREKIARVAGLDADHLPRSGSKVRLEVSPEKLEDLAALDEVRHIEEVVPPKLFNNKALGILRADSAHSHAGYEGEGQVIAVCDTGFDTGSTQNVHPAFNGRVHKLYPLGRQKADDPNGHGTHVVGSVLGDGHSNAYGRIRGAAPKARLVMQSVLDNAGGLRGLPLDLNDLFRPPYQSEKARVHTNSWGAAVYGAYTSHAYEVDEFIWNHRDLVVCFAAGNEGTDRNGNGVVDNGSVGSPGTAKNCITVGASENDRPAESRNYGLWINDFAVEPLASDLWADNPDGMAAFSSRGPTRDGRIKPDVVAPGTSILSAHSRRATVGSFWGPSQDPLFAYMGGTSMATPLVAGCAAVVREYLISAHDHMPSAALVKAMLINGARDILGQYTPSEASAIPNFAEGFGRVDLAATVDPASSGAGVCFWDEDVTLDTEEEEQHIVNLEERHASLKVTLVWTDPPGETLQNDLDLIVRVPNGEERHGNVTPPSSAFDRTNNVEQVVWEDFPAEQAEIIVRAHRITLHPQSYALVIRQGQAPLVPKHLSLEKADIDAIKEQVIHNLSLISGFPESFIQEKHDLKSDLGLSVDMKGALAPGFQSIARRSNPKAVIRKAECKKLEKVSACIELVHQKAQPKQMV